jgi:hypothetical protein
VKGRKRRRWWMRKGADRLERSRVKYWTLKQQRRREDSGWMLPSVARQAVFELRQNVRAEMAGIGSIAAPVPSNSQRSGLGRLTAGSPITGSKRARS